MVEEQPPPPSSKNTPLDELNVILFFELFGKLGRTPRCSGAEVSSKWMPNQPT